VKHTGRNGAGDHRGHAGRNPDLRVSHDIAHLEHRGSDALGDKAAEAVLGIGNHGETDHLCAATGEGRAARKAG
jgi:hypothetical protein